MWSRHIVVFGLEWQLIKCQQAELSKFDAGDKTWLYQQQLRHPLWRVGWKRWIIVEKKKSANRKAQKHSDGFGKLVFDQISLVIYCQSYACVLGNKMHGHFLKKGNNSSKSRENSEVPNTQPPIENDKDLNLSHPSVSY